MFLRDSALLAVGALGLSNSCVGATQQKRHSLFDGKTLAGWKAVPRLPVPQTAEFARLDASELSKAVFDWHRKRPESQARLKHVGRWEVVDGAIVGGQDPIDSGLGAYLISERTFADFELEIEARPDWPVDTGIMLRAHELGIVGYQVLVDHRPKGGIGGVFGNSLGAFLAAPFTLDGDKAPGFAVSNLRLGERETHFQAPTMKHAASFAEFKAAWNANDWNLFRIRCTGRMPTITTWVNGVKICELDTTSIATPNYDPAIVARRLGIAGHIALEVHDVSMANPLGWDRWAQGAVCRWRNISVQEL